MRAVCPENSNHKTFITTAHVVQDWQVDERGNYLDTVSDCIEVSAAPDKDNVWVCFKCGATAELIN